MKVGFVLRVMKTLFELMLMLPTLVRDEPSTGLTMVGGLGLTGLMGPVGC